MHNTYLHSEWSGTFILVVQLKKMHLHYGKWFNHHFSLKHCYHSVLPTQLLA
ncbi:hypothetical protein M5D96_006883 [Drosophila gunungcola]|uniref:Uncharacterized protein n=1 Tax=Drosophila gunungcola TaxID=103775 RepID=A0A9Q0BR85_9MUSC|nr:hypothetical protein M5D96_006883 [Drosophila gunungcola]